MKLSIKLVRARSTEHGIVPVDPPVTLYASIPSVGNLPQLEKLIKYLRSYYGQGTYKILISPRTAKLRGYDAWIEKHRDLLSHAPGGVK